MRSGRRLRKHWSVSAIVSSLPRGSSISRASRSARARSSAVWPARAARSSASASSTARRARSMPRAYYSPSTPWGEGRVRGSVVRGLPLTGKPSGIHSPGGGKRRMRALVLEQFNGPFVAKDVPTPAIAPHEALVRVRNVGVCGTDVKIRADRMGLGVIPLIMGHEIAGEVAEVGREVRGFAPGDRVVVNFYITCGRCPFCRAGRDTLCPEVRQHGFSIDGGFAEYVKTPGVNLCRVPDHVSLEAACILGDAVATSYHAITKRAQVRPGTTLALIGVGGEGVDVVLEFVSSAQTPPSSYQSVKRAGRLVFVGYTPGLPLPVMPHELVRNELEIVGSRANSKQELADTMELVAQGRIKPIVDRVIPLADIEDAFAALREGRPLGRNVLA